MLGKLLKYELKSTSRFMWIIYGAVLVVAALLGIVLRSMIGAGSVEVEEAAYAAQRGFGALTTASIALSFIYMLLLVAMTVLTIIMIILRFYRNLLQGEGYLMHTLPVPTWMHVVSKLIVAVLWELIAALIAVVSALIIGSTSGLMKVMMDEIELAYLVDYLKEAVNMNFGMTILLLFVTAAATILLFYLCMAIGNLANKNKILFAILAYIGIRTVLSIILAILAAALPASGMGFFFGDGSFNAGSSMLRLLIEQLILGVGSFIGTTFILNKKLNLA